MMLEVASPPRSIRGHRAKIVFTTICALLLASAVIAIGLGPTHISIADSLRAIMSPFIPSIVSDEQTRTIILNLRMPRIFLAVIIGGALAGAGTAFQSLLRNDLAEPYTLGVSSGAALAAGVVIAFGAEGMLAGLLLPMAAFLGALAVLGVVFAIAARAGRVEVRSLLLAGVIVSAFLWSVQLALFKIAGKSADEVLSWLLGHLQEATWRDDALVGGVFVVGLGLLALQGPGMNVLSLGEEQAQQLGIDVHRLKIILTLSATLLTAAAVAVTGIIGFVGLIAPHVARRLAKTPDNRIVLPLAVLCGALMTLWSDTIARLAFGGDALPVGVITAFLGAPFFAYLLRQERG